ncbi:NAD-dependent epimerase/dehydratase family protein [Phenylobacterium sp.]|uniref:NAD-dependent epimerase/dehydratase family protein n=1 Tax=Phenylobacterium sp. TaxID=1871053 RepID=UPI0037CA1968
MRVLYVGGTGEISFSCVEEAVRAGHDVTVYNRGARPGFGTPLVNHVAGDIADDALYAEVAKQNFDVVCQFLAFEPTDIDRDISMFGGRCGQYVFISSASAYAKPISVPLIREDTPLGNPFWEYSRKKAACEARLRAAEEAGDIRVTIVRPSHTYRTNLPSTVVRGDHLAWRLVNGKSVIVHGDGESVWTLTHAEDFARAFVHICGHQDAPGSVFNITDSVGHTWNRILRTVGAVIGAEPNIVNVLSNTLVKYEPSWTGTLLGDKSNSMIFDVSSISRAAGGWRCEISLEEGVERAWRFTERRLKSGYRPDPELDARIDQIIAENSYDV